MRLDGGRCLRSDSGPVAMTARTFLYPVACVLVLAGLARGPLHRATFALPVSNDDAIPLLMARHVLRGELATTLWNQPYNGALDAYLLAPDRGPGTGPRRLSALRGVVRGPPRRARLRSWLERSRDRPRDGPRGALAAFGTPYMGLMTATGPPPNFLMPLVTGFPLCGRSLLAEPGRPDRSVAEVRPRPAVSSAGSRCGTRLSPFRPSWAWGWASSSPACGPGAGRGRRAPPRGPLGASPLLVARLSGASGTSVVTAASAVTALRPRWLWPQGLSDLGSRARRPSSGFRVPLVVDGPERAPLPLLVSLALGIGLGLRSLAGVQRGAPCPLLGWAGALVGAFALSPAHRPRRAALPLWLNAPLLALAGIGARSRSRAQPASAARCSRRSRARAVGPWPSRGSSPPGAIRPTRCASGRCRPWTGDRDPARARLGSAYASLQFAGRLTLESDERVIASQAWNERIPGDPLRFRDEVDLDPRAAWVLSPVPVPRHAPRRGLPRSRARSRWHVAGGRGRRSRGVPVLPAALRRVAAGAPRGHRSLGDRVADRSARPCSTATLPPSGRPPPGYTREPVSICSSPLLVAWTPSFSPSTWRRRRGRSPGWPSSTAGWWRRDPLDMACSG